jgi:hypothetical protein
LTKVAKTSVLAALPNPSKNLSFSLTTPNDYALADGASQLAPSSDWLDSFQCLFCRFSVKKDAENSCAAT